MRILLSIPGHTRTIPMGRFTEKALQQLGHEVHVFNHERNGQVERVREKISFKRFKAYKNQQVLDLAETIKPDLFFTIYGFNHDAATLEKLKQKGIMTVCWWLNDPFDLGYKHIPAHLYDHFFSNSKGTQGVYHHYQVKNCHYLPVGIDPEVHKPGASGEKKYDIVFAGDWHPIREKALTQLVTQFQFALAGPWKRKIDKDSPLRPYFVNMGYFTPTEMAAFFSQAHIVFNLHTWFGRWSYGVNPRLFEASGCRAFQISDRKEEIQDLYEPGKEIVLYDRLEEIPELLTHYLARPEECDAIAANAYTRTLQQHTYMHRMQELLEVINRS
ncbi:CgeB family protein [Rufibacter quisquiliarum]|uniref:Spore maturation protein CgeB n=1 Tax=Rufibacter quisquiliarum TaxID=1549639 RepID=A0A839GJ03_9BACT|nr:glycosyltransferase [Rufibacter quisquiliarum]MBA9078832.1 spore maturation protein CgeB [Rufibacter quisquiliarum]